MDTGNPIRYVPIGQSGAAAVVVGALYVLGGAATIVSWVWCKFEFYEVLLMSCLLRIVAFASRAAYLLGAFHPSLVGIFLAFSNAGFGACVADMCLVTAVWVKNSNTHFKHSEHRVYRKWFYIWVTPLFLFGPGVGVLAAAFLYGDSSHHAYVIGSCLKKAATWGILVVAAVFWALMCRLATAALHEDTSAARHPADSKAKRLRGDPEGHSDLPMRNERLMALMWFCSTLGLLRAVMGVLSAYDSTQYLYTQDVPYYLLFQLPELLILKILATPTLMARIALEYPRVQDVPDSQDSCASGSDSGSNLDSRGAQLQRARSNGPDSV